MVLGHEQLFFAISLCLQGDALASDVSMTTMWSIYSSEYREENYGFIFIFSATPTQPNISWCCDSLYMVGNREGSKISQPNLGQEAGASSFSILPKCGLNKANWSLKTG